MAVPGHLLFAFLADYIYSGKSTVTEYFMLSYLLVSILQVRKLLINFDML